KRIHVFTLHVLTFCRSHLSFTRVTLLIAHVMEILKGIPVSPDVYIGEAFLQESEEARIPELYVLSELTEDEVKRFESAADRVTDEIDSIRKQTEEQLGPSLGAILSVQTQLLKDQSLRKQIVDKIRNEKFSAEHAVA